MKRYIILIVILIVFFCFYGCKGEYFGPGMADFNYNLSGDYKLFHAGQTDILDSNGTNQIIERNVTGIAWDDDFILVQQEKDNKTNYWIIHVKEKKTYGAFNKSDFENKKKDLNVNAELKLEKPEKFKHLEK